MKQLKTAGKLDTKYQDKIKIICLYLLKMRQNWHFLRTEIDSTDFKNENLTTKIRRNKAEKPYLKKKILQKILKPYKYSVIKL